MKIIFNGVENTVATVRLSYEDLAKMANINPEQIPTISYSGSTDGTLIKNEGITVEEGMIFNVGLTNNS